MGDNKTYRNLFFPTPARVACIYLLFSASWIMGTDSLAELFFKGDALAKVQSIKGLFFISISAVLIFVLLKIAHRAYAKTKASAEAANAEVKTIDANLKSALEIRAAIFEMLPAMIVTLNSAGQITDVNRSWRSYCIDHGAPARNFSIGLPYFAAVSPVRQASPADIHLVEEGLASILRQASDSFSLEFPVTTEKGRTRWFEIKIQGLSTGNERGVVVAHLDITDRKTREASLVLSEARFNALAWNAPYGIVIVRNDTILFANSAARKLFSIASEGPITESLTSYLDFSADSKSGQLLRSCGEKSHRIRMDERQIPWVDGPARLMFLFDMQQPNIGGLELHKHLGVKSAV